jgi:hypothetical protein
MACSGGLVEFLFPVFGFAIAVLALRELFEFRPAIEELLVFRCGGRRRCAGALAFVVLGRLLRNAPRTSSSDCCARAIRKPHPNATTINGMIKILDFITLPFGILNRKNYEPQRPQRNRRANRAASFVFLCGQFSLMRNLYLENQGRAFTDALRDFY